MQFDNVVDRLGTLKAQAADLSAQIKAIETNLKAGGSGSFEGSLFRATVSVAERTMVDWKSVAEKLEPSHQLVTAHTTLAVVTSVRVVARKAA